jgi:Family of unknown function (DUF6088)
MSAQTDQGSSRNTARAVRDRIRRGDARFWKHSDFQGLSPSGVATALSRLSREGELQRVAKGLYYRPVPTAFGSSMPSASAMAAATLTFPVHPAGLSAANLLGLSTQNPRRAEYATPARSHPAALSGAIIHTGRPARRQKLSGEDGAILEILRDRGRSSDLPADETARRITSLLADPDRYRRVVTASADEPPRVRAILGAIGQELEAPTPLLDKLRGSLNPLSRFDFGPVRTLRHAREWQAK